MAFVPDTRMLWSQHEATRKQLIKQEVCRQMRDHRASPNLGQTARHTDVLTLICMSGRGRGWGQLGIRSLFIIDVSVLLIVFRMLCVELLVLFCLDE